MPSNVFKTRQTKDKTLWLILFMVGFVAGVLFINFGSSSTWISNDLLPNDGYERIPYININGKQFLFYLLKERLQIIILLALLSMTSIGIIICYLYMFWLGGSLGILLGYLTLQYGLRGAGLFLASIMPHYLLYIPFYYFFFAWCTNTCIQLHYPQLLSSDILKNRKQFIFRQIWQLCILLGVAIIGIVLECYVNPIILKTFSNII